MQQPEQRALKVGALILLALVFFGAGIFLIGERNNLFKRKNHYTVHFASVAGLETGNPVQLNGVEVGTVERIELPRDPHEEQLLIEIAVDSRYYQRIRKDSRARIKTLGLLGDKYIEITSGSEEAVVITPGGEIAAAEPTDVDQLISSGEDVVENIVSISHSMVNLLDRIERGEGLVGDLVTDSGEDKPSVTDSLRSTLASVEELTTSLAVKLDEGRGPLARLVSDEELGDRLVGSVARLEGVLASVESGDGLVPSLLHDPEIAERFTATLSNLEASSARLASLTESFEDADGLLPKLLNDEEYSRQVTEEIERLLEQLNSVTEEVTQGDGTVARLIHDPQIYEALNDVVIGINESKMLRWLIRNRQKAGIERRYKDARSELEEAGEPVPELPADDAGTDDPAVPPLEPDGEAAGAPVHFRP